MTRTRLCLLNECVDKESGDSEDAKSVGRWREKVVGKESGRTGNKGKTTNYKF